MIVSTRNEQGDFMGNFIEKEVPKNLIVVSTIYQGGLIKPLFSDNNWIESATPEELKKEVPQEISKMALSIRLLERNISDQDIFDNIDSIPDSMFPPLEKAKAKVKYITARTFERHDADLNLVATMEGLSQDDVDDIFIGN